MVALAVTVAWLPALGGGFVWDDQHDLLRSDRLHHARAVVDVFAHHAMWSADQPESEIATYRPLALATLAVDYQLWGLRPAGYHATNLLLHVLATLALLAALARLLGDARAAAVLALLFALHPADAEAVAWINGRSEMLALGLGALALWAASTRRWVTMSLLLCGALLAKETALVFAPVAVVVAWLDVDARRLRWSWPPLVAALLAVGAYGGLRAHALGRTALPSHGLAALRALPAVWTRAGAAALLPARRSPVELSTWLAALSPSARAGCFAVAVALVVLLVALVARRRLLAAIGLGWWLCAIAPTAAVAALDYPWPGLARWLYVGLPGLLLFAYAAAQRLSSRVRMAVAAAVALAWAATAQRAIATWRSDEALYATMVAESPQDAWAWRALGTVRLAQRRFTDAADAFHRAAACDRTSEIHAAYALEAYAWTFLDRCDEADTQFRAHPPTPALKTEDFDAASAACHGRAAKPLTATTRRVKSAHANEETGADASTSR